MHNDFALLVIDNAFAHNMMRTKVLIAREWFCA